MVEKTVLLGWQENYLKNHILDKIVDEFNNQKCYIVNPFDSRKKQLITLNGDYLKRIINVDFKWVEVTEVMEVKISLLNDFNDISSVIFGRYGKEISDSICLIDENSSATQQSKWTISKELEKQKLCLDEVYKVVVGLYPRRFGTGNRRFKEINVSYEGLYWLENKVDTFKDHTYFLDIVEKRKMGFGVFSREVESKKEILIDGLRFLGIKISDPVCLEYTDACLPNEGQLEQLNELLDFYQKEVFLPIVRKIKSVTHKNFNMKKQEVIKIVG